jgi:hypothetical protein
MKKRGILFVFITGILFSLILSGPVSGAGPASPGVLLPVCSNLHNITITHYEVNTPSAGSGDRTVIPAWISGTSGSFQLGAINGIPPYHWAVKPGSHLPGEQFEMGFSLSESGVISGTAPMLSPSETVRISPSFTVMVWDSDTPPACDEETLSITFEQTPRPSPPVTPASPPTTVSTTATISPPAQTPEAPASPPTPQTTTITTTAIENPSTASPDVLGGIGSFFIHLFSGIFGNANDPVIGTWYIYPTNLTMRFDANGTATLQDPVTGYYAIGRWEHVAEDRYRLYSRKGTPSPVLFYDPIQDALYTDDFSTVYFKVGDER